MRDRGLGRRVECADLRRDHRRHRHLFRLAVYTTATEGVHLVRLTLVTGVALEALVEFTVCEGNLVGLLFTKLVVFILKGGRRQISKISRLPGGHLLLLRVEDG